MQSGEAMPAPTVTMLGQAGVQGSMQTLNSGAAGGLVPAAGGCCRYAAENEQARQRFDSEKTVDKLLAAAQEVASQHSSMPPADLAAIFIALNRWAPVSSRSPVSHPAALNSLASVATDAVRVDWIRYTGSLYPDPARDKVKAEEPCPKACTRPCAAHKECTQPGARAQSLAAVSVTPKRSPRLHRLTLRTMCGCRFSSAVYPGELGFLDSALRSCHQVHHSLALPSSVMW